MADNNNFFGNFLNKFKLEDESKNDRINSNKIVSNNNDGAIEVEDSYSQYMLNLDWEYNSQAELINTYREIASYSVTDYAIEDITNEMVSFSERDSSIELNLNKLEDVVSDNIRDKIFDSFDKLSNILNLDNTIHTRVRSFYVDGRLSYQKVIDKDKPGDGILDVVELDSRFVSKIRNTEYDNNSRTIKNIEEYFIYDDSSAATKEQNKANKNAKYKEALRLDEKSIVYVTSGLIDQSTGMSIGWLHKAVSPTNQLRMMENALIIYRITRAPERRIFYVDVANQPKTKAEQYIRNLKNMYRNKMSFDPESGSFKDKKHLQTMQEDMWLPRNSKGNGTEVSTLPGGQNLSDIDDVLYFQKRLFKALNVPISRLETESSVLGGGRGAEISRDELKFSKFTSKIRKRFNLMFLDLLKTDLILTKVMTIQEWDTIKNKIGFVYAQDMQLEEMRNSEIARDRLDLLEQYNPYVGKYVSNKFLRETVLQQSIKEIEDIDKEIEEELKNNKYIEDDKF